MNSNIIAPITGSVGLKNLELLDVITEIADDLYYGCNINEYTRPTDPRDIAWEEKYADITDPGKKHGGKIIFKRLADAAEKVCPDMKLYLGCEVYCETGMIDQVPEAPVKAG